MNSNRVVVYATLNPDSVDFRLLEVLLVGKYDLILPVKKAKDEQIIRNGLEIASTARLHFFECDFAIVEESQRFQEYLFENWFPLHLVITQFRRCLPSLRIDEMETSDVRDLFDQSLVTSFHFYKCVSPLLDSRLSWCLAIDHVDDAGAISFAQRISQVADEVLLESIRNENRNIKIECLKIRQETASDIALGIEQFKSFLKRDSLDATK